MDTMTPIRRATPLFPLSPERRAVAAARAESMPAAPVVSSTTALQALRRLHPHRLRHLAHHQQSLDPIREPAEQTTEQRRSQSTMKQKVLPRSRRMLFRQHPVVSAAMGIDQGMEERRQKRQQQRWRRIPYRCLLSQSTSLRWQSREEMPMTSPAAAAAAETTERKNPSSLRLHLFHYHPNPRPLLLRRREASTCCYRLR